jgi:dienelactone hydrolase
MLPKGASAERTHLYSLLGRLPDRDRPTRARVISSEDRDNYVLERLVLDLNGFEPVPAYLTLPKSSAGTSLRRPVVLYNHAHGGDYARGKDELLAGNRFLQDPPYARELAAREIAALCIDHWSFGERRGRTESEIFKHMLWEGRVMWGMMVYDSLRAIDYLASRDDIDPRRIGTLGLSMGSTMAWWLAALDERIGVCVDLCCLTDFQALIETHNLDGHGIYYYVPDLLNHFTTAQINALIAPRPHLSLAGNYDCLTPPAGLERIDAELKKVYESHGAAERWQLIRYDVGHVETAEMRGEALRFLERWL